MVVEDLVFVGSSGFVISDEDGTRGKLSYRIFCYPQRVFSSKVNITKIWTFFLKKKFFHSSLPQLLQSFGLKYTSLKRYVLYALTLCWGSISGAFEKILLN